MGANSIHPVIVSNRYAVFGGLNPVRRVVLFTDLSERVTKYHACRVLWVGRCEREGHWTMLYVQTVRSR